MECSRCVLRLWHLRYIQRKENRIPQTAPALQRGKNRPHCVQVHFPFCTEHGGFYGSIEPKVIQLAGEDGAPMPVQSIIEGAKLAAFIDEAVADALKRMEQGKSDVAQIAVEMLREVDGKRVVETMSPELVDFIQDAYQSLRWREN